MENDCEQSLRILERIRTLKGCVGRLWGLQHNLFSYTGYLDACYMISDLGKHFLPKDIHFSCLGPELFRLLLGPPGLN